MRRVFSSASTEDRFDRRWADGIVYWLRRDGEMVKATEAEFLADPVARERRVWRFDVNGFLTEWEGR